MASLGRHRWVVSQRTVCEGLLRAVAAQWAAALPLLLRLASPDESREGSARLTLLWSGAKASVVLWGGNYMLRNRVVLFLVSLLLT
ncbi:MAG: hypothetical protein ACUVX9_14025, partial [Anaerolineae bacterium]